MWRSAVQLRAGLLAGNLPANRGYSSVGRAPALQAGGQEFESPYLHSNMVLRYLGAIFLLICCTSVAPNRQTIPLSHTKSEDRYFQLTPVYVYRCLCIRLILLCFYHKAILSYIRQEEHQNSASETPFSRILDKIFPPIERPYAQSRCPHKFSLTYAIACLQADKQWRSPGYSANGIQTFIGPASLLSQE